MLAFIPLIFLDEASESGDATSSTVSTARKHRDWSAQVDSEQAQELGYNAESTAESATLPRDTGARGGRRGWRRGQPSFNREGLPLLCLSFSLNGCSIPFRL